MRLRTARLLLSALGAAAIALGGAVVAAGPASALVVGVCTIKANNPHGSTHVSGTINSEGTISCTMPMQEIFIKVYLEKSNGASWSDPSIDQLGQSFMVNYGNTSCSQSPGTFRTHVQYSILAPPGINPSYTANNLYSPWMGVVCGATLVAGAPDATETVQTVRVIKADDGSYSFEVSDPAQQPSQPVISSSSS